MSIQSKNVLNEKGQQYHICCAEGDVGGYVLLPGDPGRTDMIAKRLENARLVAYNREHKTWTGALGGVPVSVTSTGMGSPSAAIAVEELIHCGAHTFIRIGTAGHVCDASWDEELDGVVVTGAVRDEGTTRQYLPIEFPAIADRHIVAALSSAAQNMGYNYIEGIAQCKDSFYGQHDPDSMPVAYELNSRWEAWRRGGVMCSEMESAALFILCAVRGARGGAIMSFKSMENTVDIAVEALKTLIEADKAKPVGANCVRP